MLNVLRSSVTSEAQLPNMLLMFVTAAVLKVLRSSVTSEAQPSNMLDMFVTAAFEPSTVSVFSNLLLPKHLCAFLLVKKLVEM